MEEIKENSANRLKAKDGITDCLEHWKEHWDRCLMFQDQKEQDNASDADPKRRFYRKLELTLD